MSRIAFLILFGRSPNWWIVAPRSWLTSRRVTLDGCTDWPPNEATDLAILLTRRVAAAPELPNIGQFVTVL